MELSSVLKLHCHSNQEAENNRKVKEEEDKERNKLLNGLDATKDNRYNLIHHSIYRLLKLYVAGDPEPVGQEVIVQVSIYHPQKYTKLQVCY